MAIPFGLFRLVDDPGKAYSIHRLSVIKETRLGWEDYEPNVYECKFRGQGIARAKLIRQSQGKYT